MLTIIRATIFEQEKKRIRKIGPDKEFYAYNNSKASADSWVKEKRKKVGPDISTLASFLETV